MTIPVNCEGTRIIIGIDQGGVRGPDQARFVYYLMSDYHYYRQPMNFASDEKIERGPQVEVPPLYSDDIPNLTGGQVARWFQEDLIDRVFPLASGPEKEQAWEGFCDYYEKRREKVTTWVGVLERTEKVIIYPHEILEIQIDDHTCRLEGDEVLMSRVFARWYLYRFNALLSMKNEEWGEMMGHWLEMGEEGELEESVTAGSGVLTDVLNTLRDNEETFTTTREELEENPRLPHLMDGELLLSNKVVYGIVNGDGISMRKFASIAKDFLAGNSIELRIGKGKQRFWRFDPAKVGVGVQRTLEEDDQ